MTDYQTWGDGCVPLCCIEFHDSRYCKRCGRKTGWLAGGGAPERCSL